MKVNSPEIVPLGFLTCSLSPGLVFLPAFLPISAVFGFWSSFLVYCSSPFSSITAPSSKFSPKTNSFLPVTEALVILTGSPA